MGLCLGKGLEMNAPIIFTNLGINAALKKNLNKF